MMRPVDTDDGLLDEGQVLGLCRIEKPHNENPVGVFNVKRLKRVLSIAGKLDYDEVWLWSKRVDDAGILAMTDSRGSNVAVVLAGMTEPGDNDGP